MNYIIMDETVFDADVLGLGKTIRESVGKKFRNPRKSNDGLKVILHVSVCIDEVPNLLAFMLNEKLTSPETCRFEMIESAIGFFETDDTWKALQSDGEA